LSFVRDFGIAALRPVNYLNREIAFGRVQSDKTR